MSLAEAFFSLFEGNASASYNYDPGREPQKYFAVERGLNLEDIEGHLAGRLPSVLSIPILPNGLVHFAAGDCDRHAEEDEPIDHAAVARRITELGLPLVITRSKSPKSAHCWLSYKDVAGFSAAIARQLIEKYMKLLGLSVALEIFPKQIELKADQIGSGINLPYFSGERIAFGRDGEELDLAGFIELVRARQAFGQVLATRDLAGSPSASGSPGPSGEEHPMLKETALGFHANNLKALQASNEIGHWNDQLNTTAFFAARCFGAHVFEQTVEQVKDGIRTAAKARTGSDERQMESTLSSGWESGISKPLKLLEDLFPERTATLREFNERFYVVEDFGGRCRICWEEIDETTGSLYLGNQDFADFTKAHMHEQILVGQNEKSIGSGKNRTTVEQPEYMSKAEFWLKSPERRQFRKVVFAPNEKLAPNVKNLWRGFRVEAKQGRIDLYLEHVLENVCKGQKNRFDWLIKWMAWKVRNPGLMNGTCPVFLGREGVGKNMCVDPFAFLFGPHAFAVTKREHVTGHFNAHLRACCVLIGNEALYAGDKSQESTLKSLITDDTYVLEPKGVDSTIARNRISLMIVSNEPWVVPASVGARRFSVFDVGDKHREDFPYFNAIQVQLSGGRSGNLKGYRALLHYLLNEVELTDFQPQKIIVTEALAGQQAQSLRGIEALWHAVLYRGELPGGLKGNSLQSERLLTWAQRQHNRKYEGITDRQLGQLLGENTVGENKGMGFKHAQPRPIVDGHQVRAWQIPSLRDARARWSEVRFQETWPDVEPVQLSNGQGRPEHDPDDWRLVPVGDEDKTVRHEHVNVGPGEPEDPNDIPGSKVPF